MNLNLPKSPMQGNGGAGKLDPISFIGPAVAQLLASLAGIQDALEDIADAQDELVWLAEETAIKNGIVTREDIEERAKDSEDSGEDEKGGVDATSTMGG